MELNAKIPEGPLAEKWQRHLSEMKLVNPANKRKFDVIVVGSGLAGASASATMAELGYRVTCLCFQDSSRRAHSIAAQGGINAAKNYQNDGDSVYRLFYDTIKGGDFRSREANTHRLAEVSTQIIDQCYQESQLPAYQQHSDVQKRARLRQIEASVGRVGVMVFDDFTSEPLRFQMSDVPTSRGHARQLRQ